MYDIGLLKSTRKFSANVSDNKCVHWPQWSMFLKEEKGMKNVGTHVDRQNVRERPCRVVLARGRP